MDNDNIYSIIKNKRVKNSLSLETLSFKSGVDTDTIKKIENSESNCFNTEIDKLCLILNINKHRVPNISNHISNTPIYSKIEFKNEKPIFKLKEYVNLKDKDIDFILYSYNGSTVRNLHAENIFLPIKIINNQNLETHINKFVLHPYNDFIILSKLIKKNGKLNLQPYNNYGYDILLTNHLYIIGLVQAINNTSKF